MPATVWYVLAAVALDKYGVNAELVMYPDGFVALYGVKPSAVVTCVLVIPVR